MTATVPKGHAHADPLQVTHFESDQVLDNREEVVRREEVVIPFMSKDEIHSVLYGEPVTCIWWLEVYQSER